MLEQLKAKWVESPWYLKIGIPLVALLLLVMKVASLIGLISDEKARAQTDQRAATLEQSEDAAKAQAQVLQGQLNQLEQDKADNAKKAEEDDAINFHNNR